MAFDPRNSTPGSILLVFVTIAGLLGAVLMGQMVAGNDFTRIALIAAVGIAMTIFLFMGKNIWLLVPLFWPLTGKVSVLPLPFSVRELGILAALGLFCILAAFKKLPRIARPTFCDRLLFLNIAYLVTVYLRNPVGVNAFGSELIGGRPYFEIFLSLAAYWVLQHVTLDAKQARRFPFLMSAGSIVVSSLSLLTSRLPFLVPILAPFYSGLSVGNYLSEYRGEDSTKYREAGGLSFGSTWTTLLSSYYRPVILFLFLKPVQSVLYYAAILAILMSGFRVGVLQFIGLMLLTSYFQRGLSDCIKITAIIFTGIILIIGAQVAGAPVHPAIQRALSFIPGQWDEAVVRDAEGTKEWRLTIWKTAWESDKYIKNKILGDGFGFTAADLAIQRSAEFGGMGYLGGNEAEAQLVSGAYHSGPLSTIRYVGMVGLAFYLILLIGLAFYAYRIIKLASGTPFLPLALFVGVGPIMTPLFFVFIFGAYDSGFSETVFALAALNLTLRSLQLHLTGEKMQADPPRKKANELLEMTDHAPLRS